MQTKVRRCLFNAPKAASLCHPTRSGVTVWELGQLHRGAWAHRYWSSSGCLFHHPYPVGYRATKVCCCGRMLEQGGTAVPAVLDQRKDLAAGAGTWLCS